MAPGAGLILGPLPCAPFSFGSAGLGWPHAEHWVSGALLRWQQAGSCVSAPGAGVGPAGGSALWFQQGGFEEIWHLLSCAPKGKRRAGWWLERPAGQGTQDSGLALALSLLLQGL